MHRYQCLKNLFHKIIHMWIISLKYCIYLCAKSTKKGHISIILNTCYNDAMKYFFLLSFFYRFIYLCMTKIYIWKYIMDWIGHTVNQIYPHHSYFLDSLHKISHKNMSFTNSIRSKNEKSPWKMTIFMIWSNFEYFHSSCLS